MKPERIEDRGSLFALECDGCNRRIVVAVQVGEVKDYMSHTATLCRDCLIAALELLPEPVEVMPCSGS